ncbi:hypothetical protein JCM3774_004972 [Rhodotorula dairenensis]
MARAGSHESDADTAPGPDHAQDALAQLERLLEAQLAPDSAPDLDHAAAAPPPKKKKNKHVPHSDPPPDPAEPHAGAQPRGGLAFRLFSTQRTPQAVVIRAESTPPPVVVDPRIRDVQDEDPEKVDARRTAIAAVAIDGATIQSQAKSLPSPHPPSYRLSHRVLTPSSYRAVRKTLSPRHSPAQTTLAYLDACLPRPLLALSPWPVPVPEGTEPPRTPHEGLLAVPPFNNVYDRRSQCPSAQVSGDATSSAMPAATKKGQQPPPVAGSGGEEGEAKQKKKKKETRLPRLPKRNRAFELGDGTGHGALLRLEPVYPPPSPSTAKAVKAPREVLGRQQPLQNKRNDVAATAAAAAAAAASTSRGGTSSKRAGKRLSKARRVREKLRTTEATHRLVL